MKKNSEFIHWQGRSILSLMSFSTLLASGVFAENIETAGKARFTLLTDRMVRCEWSEDGKFEDRPSLTFLNRSMPEVKHTFERKGEGVVITTERMRLEWAGGAFNETNLVVRITGEPNRRLGTAALPTVAVLAEDKENLLGTMRTIDGRSSVKDLLPRMEKGILSRRGVTVVDDTATPLFVKGSDYWKDWVEERPKRPAGAYRDLTVFAYGHDYKGCLGDYVRVAGRIPLPPRWAFGYWWSRFWCDSESDYRQIVREMKSVGIPMDVCVIEMYWHETWNIADRPDVIERSGGQLWGWGGYTWNRRYFPDPAETFRFLHGEGLKAPLNMHPACGIPECEDVYPRFARDYEWKEKGTIPFRAAEERWAEVYFKDIVEPLEALGADFFWLDWQQQLMSKEKPTLSNTFWLNHLFATHDARRRGGTKRPIIYHRWGGLGSHRYQIGFSGDGESSWRMLEAIPWFTATASNVGYGYWGHDLGGHNRPNGDYNENGNAELFTRWMQCGVFTPIFRTHPTKDSRQERRPWRYADHFFTLREAYRLRYRLAPYIYTAAREAYDTGVCLCRPMYYDWPEEDAAYEADNEFMFGNDILVAPVSKPADPVTTEAEVDVWFPKGTWYDVSKGELVEGGNVQKRGYTVEETPWFVKAGAVIPMYPDSVMNLGTPGTDNLVLFCAPGGSREIAASVYEDDGDNADYATNFRRTVIRREGARVTIAPRKGAYTLTFPLAAVPLAAKVNGKECTWEYDADDFAVVVKTPYQDGTRETVVELVYPKGAATTVGILSGMKGAHRRVAALTDAFRSAIANLRPGQGFRGWPLCAANLPISWQTVWKTRDAIAAHPADAVKLLAEREAAIKAFASKDWPRFKPTMQKDFLDKMDRWLTPSSKSRKPSGGAPRLPAAWTKFTGNPVLGDPKKLGTCFDVNVIKGRDAKFDMYFSWRPKKSLAVVSSEDGVNWSEPEIVLRPDETCGWEQIVNRACVVQKDGKWHMWYTGQVLKERASRIGYAVSDDGRNFRKVQKAPVMVAEAPFEQKNVMCPHVIWDTERSVWRMWYSAGEMYEPNVNCYAESKDGINWEKSPHNPVLAKGTREWEQNRVGGCEVRPLPDGSFVMFYIGYKDINTAAIGAAVSKDGITGWRRLKANPLVVPTPDTFDASACYKPSVFRDAARDRWLLWYNGRNRNKGEYIGLVVKDGLDLGELEY